MSHGDEIIPHNTNFLHWKRILQNDFCSSAKTSPVGEIRDVNQNRGLFKTEVKKAFTKVNHGLVQPDQRLSSNKLLSIFIFQFWYK